MTPKSDDLGLGQGGDAQRRGTAISRSQQQETVRRDAPDLTPHRLTLRDLAMGIVYLMIGDDNG